MRCEAKLLCSPVEGGVSAAKIEDALRCDDSSLLRCCEFLAKSLADREFLEKAAAEPLCEGVEGQEDFAEAEGDGALSSRASRVEAADRCKALLAAEFEAVDTQRLEAEKRLGRRLAALVKAFVAAASTTASAVSAEEAGGFSDGGEMESDLDEDASETRLETAAHSPEDEASAETVDETELCSLLRGYRLLRKGREGVVRLSQLLALQLSDLSAREFKCAPLSARCEVANTAAAPRARPVSRLRLLQSVESSKHAAPRKSPTRVSAAAAV